MEKSIKILFGETEIDISNDMIRISAPSIVKDFDVDETHAHCSYNKDGGCASTSARHDVSSEFH